MRTVDPERHAARRTQILQGAATAFAQKGYDNTTVKDVYTAAGVGSGTLFHYFADKRAIFHGVLEADRDTLLSDLAAIDITDAHAAMWAVIDRMTADLHDPAVGSMMLAILGQLTVDPRVVEILDEGDAGTRALLADLIGRLQAAGDADPDWDRGACGAVGAVDGRRSVSALQRRRFRRRGRTVSAAYRSEPCTCVARAIGDSDYNCYASPPFGAPERSCQRSSSTGISSSRKV